MMIRTILATALLALAAGCTQGPQPEPTLGLREAVALEKALAGKVAGEPVACIAAYNSSELRALGDNVLVYRANKNLIYRNNLVGSCNGLARGDILVLTRTIPSQYCRGDMAQVVDAQIGMMRGACSLGSFVPYRTAGK